MKIIPFNFDNEFYQTRIGNYGYIRDYHHVIGKKKENGQAFTEATWVFRQLTPYWYDYIIHRGFKEFRPIKLSARIIGLLYTFFTPINEQSYSVDGTPFTLITDSDGVDITLGTTKIFRTKYLHQLQNAYFSLTGVELHDDGLAAIFPELEDTREKVTPWIEKKKQDNAEPARVRRALSL